MEREKEREREKWKSKHQKVIITLPFRQITMISVALDPLPNTPHLSKVYNVKDVQDKRWSKKKRNGKQNIKIT